MSSISINAVIISAADLDAGIKQVEALPVPIPPAGLTDKYRWIQCRIKNETQFPLLLQQTYFGSGRYWTSPGSTSSFSMAVFSGCNGDGTIWTGVSAGNTWTVVLDGSHNFDLSFGWSSPNDGAYKAGVVESTNDQAGYDCATATGNAIYSADTYQSKDASGNPISIRFHVSAAPGQEALFVITEIIMN